MVWKYSLKFRSKIHNYYCHYFSKNAFAATVSTSLVIYLEITLYCIIEESLIYIYIRDNFYGT
jgi:hypothetical protein